jgi:putative transposase
MRHCILPGTGVGVDTNSQVGEMVLDTNLTQEFITPYTPEQNGIIERFFRSLKEECVWQHVFRTFEDARRVIRDWMQWYNQERPHQALGYRSPVQYRAQQVTQVA